MKVVISIDEMKPHWAAERGLDKEAERLGMKNVKISGNFDAKLTNIYGTIDDFEKFESAMKLGPLSEGSLFPVATGGAE